MPADSPCKQLQEVLAPTFGMIPLDRDASRPIKTFPPVTRGYSHTPQVRRHSGSPHFLPAGCPVPLTAGTFFRVPPGIRNGSAKPEGLDLCHAAPARSVPFCISGHVLSGFPVLRMTQLCADWFIWSASVQVPAESPGSGYSAGRWMHTIRSRCTAGDPWRAVPHPADSLPYDRRF